MVTPAAEPIFVDTNVLVYANVATAAEHLVARQALPYHAQAGSPLWIRRPVLREYLSTLTRPQTFAAPQPRQVVVARIRYFQSEFFVANDTEAVTEHLLALLEQVRVGGKQVHDANIVATMLANGVTRLLTANPSDFVRFARYIGITALR